jgi:Inhibitor of Apoptosis domain
MQSERCVHPEFRDVNKRLNTLDHMPDRYADRFADAGFFYRPGVESLNCFRCGLLLLHTPDDPYLEHARLNPFCEHMRSVKGPAYVEHVKNTYPKPSKPWEGLYD